MIPDRAGDTHLRSGSQAGPQCSHLESSKNPIPICQYCFKFGQRTLAGKV